MGEPVDTVRPGGTPQPSKPLTKRQLEALVIVASHCPTPSDDVAEYVIANDMETTIQGVTKVLGNLWRLGLVVERTQGRRHFWRLTDEGRQRLLMAAMLA